jgi:MFS superfamily sulfate permease-like transporter
VSSHDSVIYRIVGDLTYISAITHQQRLHRFHPSKHVILSLRYCYYIDLDGLDALEESIEELLETEGRKCALAGIPPILLPLFLKCAWFVQMKNDGLIFDCVQDAAKYLQTLPSSRAVSPTQQRRRESSNERKLSFDSSMA